MSETDSAKIDGYLMDRGVGINVVRLTEGAARSAANHMGLGAEQDIFQSALDGFLSSLDLADLKVRFIQGDCPPEISQEKRMEEEFGTGRVPVDLALHAVECLTACALGGRNAMSAVVVAPRGSIRTIPDVYMEKIACGPELKDAISFDMPFMELLPNVAQAKGVSLDQLTVTILDRPRNRDWIVTARETGVRVRLIADGDLAAAISTCTPESGVDLLVGSGGAFEGVLAAAALKGLRGGFLGRFLVKSEDHHRSVLEAGYDNPRQVLAYEDLLPEEYVFSATGITDGEALRGVQYRDGIALSESLMVRTASHTVRWVRSEHDVSSESS